MFSPFSTMTVRKGLLNFIDGELIETDLNMMVTSVAAAALVPDSSTSITALCTICRGDTRHHQVTRGWDMPAQEMAKLLPGASLSVSVQTEPQSRQERTCARVFH